ncbi:MAG: winged helix-turn-helix transcriptional regulator [Crocinitomicaceae bacterium]|nr:winged helix-turn-helix transcriptional regulator [Crocinitomicaceae bacterium]
MLEQQAKILNNLGLIFYEITDFESALKYFKKSLKILEELGTAETSGYIWLSIAGAQFELNLEKDTLDYAEKAIGILELQQDKISLSICHSLLTRIYEKKGKTERAIISIQKSIEISEEIGNPSSTIEYKVFLANLTLEHNLEKAMEIAKEGLAFINTSNEAETSLKKDVYDLLYKCYKAKGESELSLIMLEKYTQYSDSLSMEKKNYDIIKITIQDEYQKELSAEKRNNDKETTDLKRSQSTQLVVITSIALGALIILFLFFRWKNVQSNREREALLEEIDSLKSEQNKDEGVSDAIGFRLDREKIEAAIDRKINETDWNVLNILLDDPVISNKDIAAKAFLSVDGIGSSLRRMYEFLEIKESKYKKISLLLEAVKISNQ